MVLQEPCLTASYDDVWRRATSPRNLLHKDTETQKHEDTATGQNDLYSKVAFTKIVLWIVHHILLEELD